MPSPQIGGHVSGVLGVPPVQLYPVKTAVQSAFHPFVPLVSPSSQTSPMTLLLSPHIGSQLS